MSAAPRPQVRRISWCWWALAAATSILVGVTTLHDLPRNLGSGIAFCLVWMTPLGLIGYAAGARARPLWLWRIYALVFSVVASIWIGQVGAWAALGALGRPGGASPVLVVLSLCYTVIAVAIIYALLHYAKVIGRQPDGGEPSYEQVFA